MIQGGIANQLGFLHTNINPPVTNTGWRFADATDAAQIYNANIGDFIIDGPNIENANDTAIDMRVFFNNTITDIGGVPIAAGKKILIKGGWYSYVSLEIPDVTGTLGNEVVITNYFGQVKIGGFPTATSHIFGIAGGTYWKLTGKYDPVAKTGDVNFRGHDAGYAYSQGTYGFYHTMEWRNTNGLHVSIGGSPDTYMANNFEVEYVEVANGGGSGFNLKYDNPPVITNMTYKLHDCYVHDICEEGLYTGNQSVTNQHRLVNCKIYNNRFIRVGNEGIQINNAAEGVDVYNNVVVRPDMSWMNPFGLSQDRGIQLNTRNGKVRFYNNIVIAVEDYMLVLSNAPGTGGPSDNPVAGQDIEFLNNFFYGSGNFGGYIFPPTTDTTTGFKINDNYFFDFTFNYNEVYPSKTNQNVIFDIDNSSVPIQLLRNYYQSGKTFIRNGAGNPNITASNNTALASIEYPAFVDSGYPPGFTLLQLKRWSATIGEAAGFPSSGTNKGQPLVFNQGSYCTYNSLHYRSRINNNAGNQPQGFTDSFWDLITFNNGTSLYPPDDYRLTTTDTYNYLGMGLLDNLTPVAPNVTFNAPEVVVEVPNIGGFTSDINLVAEEIGNNQTQLRFGYSSSTFGTGARIVAIGSSTLVGSGATSPYKLNEQLAAWVSTNITNGEFYYMAVAGTYSDYYLPDGEAVLSDWNRNIDAALALNPDILIVSLPSNDVSFNSVSTFVNNLKRIDTKCKEKNVHAFFTTTQPRSGFSASDQQKLYDAAISIISEFGSRAVNVFTELAEPYTVSFPAKTKAIYDSGDTIHVNNAGHTYITNQIIAAMQAYFIDKYIKYELQVATSVTGPFTNLDTSIPGTTSVYSVTRTSNATRYYRIRGQRTDTTFTPYTDPIAVTQPVYAGQVLQTIQVNFNTSSTAGVVPQWNEFLPTGDIPNVGETITNISDTAGLSTTIDVTISGDGFESSTNQGGSAGVFPLSVIRSYWFWGANSVSAKKAELTITGLDDNYLYNFKSLFSKQAASAYRFVGACIGDRRTSYPANDPVTSSNNSVTSDLLSIRPSGGTVVIKYKALATAGFGYLNALQIEKLNNANNVVFDAPAAEFSSTSFDVLASAGVEGTVQINFTGSVASGATGWNDFNVVSGVDLQNMLTSTGQTTTIDINVTNVESATADNGSSYVGNTDWPASVVRYTRYRSGSPAMVVKLKGLNSSKVYDIHILASRASNSNVVGSTINGVLQTQAVSSNLTPVIFSNIAPDTNNEITITQSYVSGGSTGFQYITAMKVVIKTPSSGPVTFSPPVADFEVGVIDIPSVPGNVVFSAPVADLEVGTITIQQDTSPATITTQNRYINPASDTHRMWIFQPEGYLNDTDDRALIIFLAGSGQVAGGTTVANVDDQGVPAVITAGDRPDPRFIICAPHVAGIASWDQTFTYNGTTQMYPKWAYDYMVANYRINTNKVYVTGLSLGGAGSALFAQAYPNLVTAIIPCAGTAPATWNSTTGWPDLINIPTMPIHGTSDGTFTASNAFKYAQYLNPLSATFPPELRIYFGATHSSNLWTDKMARRKSSTVAGNKAEFDYDKWFWKFSKDAVETAQGHADYAAETLDIEDYWKAKRLADALPSSSAKTTLLATLATLRTTIIGSKTMFLVDMGGSVSTSPTNETYINSITSASTSSTISNIVNINGGASTYGFTIVSLMSNWESVKSFSDRMNGPYRGLPSNFSRDAFTVSPTGGSMRFTGLNNSKTYTIRIFGAQDNGDTSNQNSVLRVTVGASTVDKYVLFNTTGYHEFTNITPSSGNITMTTISPNAGVYVCITGVLLIEN